MDINCSNIKMEDSSLANFHHHRQSSDWSDVNDFDSYVLDMKNAHATPTTTTSSASINTVDTLDSSTGLSCSTLNLNGSNGHHYTQQQQSLHTLEASDHQQSTLAYFSSSSAQCSVTPVDMEDQDRIKLERKRMRNRIAASKCRKRKIENITKLEEKIQQVKAESNELQTFILKYREQLAGLKAELIQHAKNGCSIPQSLQFMT